jgi:DHA2 family multidrug resistance protein
VARYLPESKPKTERLDLFGFITLSLAIGMLQMFLDRGEQLDWFGSPEICIEAALSAVAFAFFIAHTATARGISFFNRALLKDRNFVTGMLFAFIVGMILYGTMALLPSFLQGLMDYPIVYTGMVTAPRGIGTMLAMMLVGRLTQKVDVRLIMAVGFGLTATALWQMTRMTLQMDSTLVIVSGFIQGLGVGFTFVPLSTATFATLAPSLRNEGTPIFSLLRNIGSSVGISVVTMLLAEHAATAHVRLVENMNPAALGAFVSGLDPTSPGSLAMLNAEATRQATLIAYLGDFKIMMAMAVVSIPMLLLIRRPPRGPAGGAPIADAAH